MKLCSSPLLLAIEAAFVPSDSISTLPPFPLFLFVCRHMCKAVQAARRECPAAALQLTQRGLGECSHSLFRLSCVCVEEAQAKHGVFWLVTRQCFSARAYHLV